MRAIAIGMMVLVGLGSIACKPRSPQVLKVVKSSRSIPAPPPVRHIAVDPELRARAITTIVGGLKAVDPIERIHSIEALQLIGGAGQESRIAEQLKDGNPRVRFAAAMASGELKIADAKPLLEGLVSDDDDLVQIASRFALHQLGNARYSQELVDYAQSDLPHVRAQTAMILGLMGNRTALVILRPMRADPQAVVRLQVAEAMWRLGDEQGLESVLGATYSRYPDDRLIAILALAGPRDLRVIEHVRAHLTDDHPEVQLVAARTMGLLGSDDGYRIAVNHIASPDARRRQLAAFALGAIARADSQEYLRQLLDDSNTDVRLSAAVAIMQLR